MPGGGLIDDLAGDGSRSAQKRINDLLFVDGQIQRAAHADVFKQALVAHAGEHCLDAGDRGAAQVLVAHGGIALVGRHELGNVDFAGLGSRGPDGVLGQEAPGQPVKGYTCRRRRRGCRGPTSPG